MIGKPAATAATCGRNTLAIAEASVMNSSDHRRLSSVTAGRSSGSIVCVRAVASRRAIGGEASARRPSQTPISTAPVHQTALKIDQRAVGLAREADDGQRGEQRGGAGAEEHRRLEEVAESHRSVEQGLEQVAHAVGPVDHHVGLARQRRRALVRPHADAHRRAQAAALDQLGEAAEGVEVRGVVADVERRRRACGRAAG